MSINWVTLNEKGEPVPLPNEEFIYVSTKGQRIPLRMKTVGDGGGSRVESGNGRIWLSTERIVYIVEEGERGEEGVVWGIWDRLREGSGYGRGGKYHVGGLGDRNFDNLSVALKEFESGRLVQPWVGPNGWAGVFRGVRDGGLEPEGRLWEMEVTFMGGGAVEFGRVFERAVRARELEQSHIEELPVYSEG